MYFSVRIVSAEEFEAWVAENDGDAAVAADADAPDEGEGGG
jgi:heme/copper-type cytochrome/quinol oxidase subunit 2